MALLPGSDAIGAGDPGQAGTTAQNGVIRPAAPDIGAYQTGAVAPVVTANTAPIPGDTTAIGIGGIGFDPNVANDSITLSNGVTGSVYFASATTLDFTVNGLNNVPAGTALYATVTVDGQSSGGPVQIGTVESSMGAPTITPDTAPIPANADGSGIDIGGSGFDPDVANESITLDNGLTGTVYFASSTTLDFTVNGLSSLTGGTAVHASVTVDGVSSGSPVQIFTVAPVVTANTAPIPSNTTAIGIGGFGFDPDAANDTITLDNGVTGTVYFASSTTLDFTVNGLSSVPAGTPLYATVTVDGESSGAIGGPVQIGTVTGAGVNWIVTDPNGNTGSGSPTDVTLPYAVANAQNGDSISFASDLSGDTIYLNSTLAVNSNVTITGLGAANLAVSGQYLVGDFAIGTGVTASISGMTIEDAYGSGVYNSPAATLTLNADVFADNHAQFGAGLDNGGTLFLTNSTFTGNVAIDGGLGGGFFNFGTMVATNNTFTGNTALYGGGGITYESAYASTLTLTNDTIANNTATSGYGGGLWEYAYTTMDNTIVAGNNGSDVYGLVDVVNYSLIGNTSDMSIGSGAGNQLNVSADLDSLAYNNGAPTQTLALLPGSPAFGAGDPSQAGTISQNGVARPSIPDIGAYETGTVAPVVTPNTAPIPANADGDGVGIGGSGFDPNAANDIITLSNGVTGSVYFASPTTLDFTINGLSSLTGGTPLFATVTVDGVSSGSSVQILTVAPVVATNTAPIPSNTTAIGIGGLGFDPDAANDSITLNDGVTGSVYFASATTLDFTVNGLNNVPAGTALYATVTVDGVSSGNSVQVGTVGSGGFAIEGVTTMPDGFVLTFTGPINPSTTVLYSSPGDTTLGAADVTVTGPSGSVRGSLVIDPTDPNVATFVQTSGLLTPGSYTVMVTNAVKEVGGSAMAGNYTSTLMVTAPTTPVLSVPSFARGPGQSVALTDTLGNTTGIPVDISKAADATQVSFTLTYDPTLLTIASSGALSLSSAATAAGINTISYSIMNEDTNHNVLTVTLTSGVSGGSGLTTTLAETFVTIQASVPVTARYSDKAVLNLGSVVVNGSNGAGVSGVDAVAYPGDVLGTGLPNATDASLVDQVGSGSGTGFSAFKDLDPAIIGGVGGGMFLNANDASLIDEAASGATIPQITSIPVGVSLTFGGPDPYLYLSAVQGSPGQTVTETLYLDVTDPNGIQLTALDEAIAFDAGVLQISDVRGTNALAALGSYETASTVDNESGEFLVGQAFMGTGLPPVVPYGTDIPVLQFNVSLNADMGVGSECGLTLLQYGTVNNVTQYTAVSDNEGALTWTPGKVPSNSGNAAIDGSVTVVPEAVPVMPTSLASAQQPPVVIQPKVVEPVRKVTSLTAVNQPAATTAAPGTSVTLVASLMSIETPLATAETVVANVSPSLQSSVALVQPESAVMSYPVTGSSMLAAEAAPIATVASSPARTVDPGASLSLAVLGTSKGIAVTPLGTSSVRTSTSVLDDVYRQSECPGHFGGKWHQPGGRRQRRHRGAA